MLKHRTVQGETFDMLALQYYTDEKLAHEIMAANPDHAATLVFDAGVLLDIPEQTAVVMPETLPPWRRGA